MWVSSRAEIRLSLPMLESEFPGQIIEAKLIEN